MHHLGQSNDALGDFLLTQATKTKQYRWPGRLFNVIW
jgi:hypothetical protein